jgi:hypothetical protein
MTYNFPKRLQHVSKRMSQVNTACALYVRGGIETPIDISPILISPDELNVGGDPSLVHVERQDFVVWKCDRGPDGKIGLGTLYPPRPSDKIVFQGDTFSISSMGMDDPPFIHTTSNRDRLIIHTVRTGTG